MSEPEFPFLKKVFMVAGALPTIITTIGKDDLGADFQRASAMVKGANLYDRLAGREPRNTVGQELEYQRRHGNNP
jgi:hypothetical protein